MKKILLIVIATVLFIGNSAYAANTGKDINNKCRSNLKLLNAGTADMLKKVVRYDLPKWTSLAQATNSFLDPEKYLEGKKIEGPTPDCQYFLVSLNNNEYQWLCNLHGVIEGDKTVSFRYREHQLQGKTSEKYMINENYKEHVQNLLHWTEYTPTPLEAFKYQYNMNPITTTIISIILVVVSIFTLKTFFKF